MSRTLKELDSAVPTLAVELEKLKQSRPDLQGNAPHPFDQRAGCFTHDEDWLPMMEAIQRARHDEQAAEQPEADLVAA